MRLPSASGTWEARSEEGEPFGLDRLRDHLAASVELPLEVAVRRLVASVQAHQANADFEDDYTVVGIERAD